MVKELHGLLGIITLIRMGGEGTVLSLCVCVCVSVFLSVCLSLCYHKIAVKFIYKQATSHKLRNLKQMVLFKAGKFLQASMAQVVCKFENKTNYSSYMKDYQVKGIILLEN